MKFSRLHFIVVLILVVSAANCRSERQAESKEKLRIGYIPVADCSQLFIAIENGYFEKRGIEVELVNLPGGAKILEALGAGSLEIGFSNLVSLVLAHDAGLPFRAFTGGPAEDTSHKEHAILVPPDSQISRITDLSGKTIALNTRRNIDELMVTLLLKANRIDPGSVNFVEVPFPRMLSSFESGQVHAAAAIEPYVTIGTATNSGRVLSFNYVDIQPVTEISAFVADNSWLKKNPNVAEKFAAAIDEASVFANSDPKEVRIILAKYTKIDAAFLDEVVLPVFTKKVSVERLNNTIEQVHAMGWIKASFSASEIIADVPLEN